LSAGKTKITPLVYPNIPSSHVPPDPRPAIEAVIRQGIKVSYDSFRYLCVEIGPMVDSVAVWNNVAQGFHSRLPWIPMRDLSLSERVHLVNTVGFTRFFYLDRFCRHPRRSSPLSAR
jgi:hypothetical protein